MPPTNHARAANPSARDSSRVPAIGSPFHLGHLPRAVNANHPIGPLLIYKEEHPPAVRDAQHQQGVSMPALGVRVAEALLGFERRNTVAAQQFLFVVLIPLELRQRSTSRLDSPDVS